MKKFVCYVAVLLVLVTISCRGDNHKKDLLKFTGQEIVLPDKMRSVVNGMDSLVTGFLDAETKLIVFYDSVGCSSCRVNNMYEWRNIIDYSERMGKRFKTVFIFAPKRSEAGKLLIALRSSRMDYPMFIDAAGDFLNLNPTLPADSKFHSFLLDKDNKVVLIGNPIGKQKLWDLYKKQIIELTQN